MLIRSAFWVGNPQSGRESEFRALVVDVFLPAMKRFPGVKDVRAFWPRQMEDDPPAIYCQVVVEFASADQLEVMLASAERTALRPRVLEAVAMFEGSLSHINYEVV